MCPAVSRLERVGWVVTMGLLLVFAIPWFLWGADRLLFGLPVWLWWHIGWLVVTSAVFWLFTTRAWGIGITDPRETGTEGRVR
jgi:hypothetical protein